MTKNRLTDQLSDRVINLFRIVLAILFVSRGAASLFGVFGGHRGSGEALAMFIWPNWWAALIQFVGGVLVLTGLWTRAAAIICSGSMAYAYFVAHQPDGLLPLNNGGELAAIFCWSFLLVAVLGPGSFSVDRLLAARRHQENLAEPVPVTT